MIDDIQKDFRSIEDAFLILKSERDKKIEQLKEKEKQDKSGRSYNVLP